MEICYSFPHVFFPGSDPEENACVLKASLDYLTKINLIYLRNHVVPALYQSGVVYGRTQLWEPIPALYKRRFGDCKSLSAAYRAQLIQQGIECDAVFRFAPRSDGATDYHILIQTADGFHDPSKVLGMGKNENEKFYPPQ